MSHVHPDANGIIVVPLIRGNVIKYSKNIDFVGFYKALVGHFENEGFKDMLGPDQGNGNFLNGQAGAGEQVNEVTNRTGNMYEYHFMALKEKNGNTNFEVYLKARLHSSITPYGWIEVKFNIENRFYKDVEILEGNNKKVLQAGTWEIRNEILYKNSVYKDYLSNVPIVKNSSLLKDFYFNQIYHKIFLEELHWAEHNVLHDLYHVIDHYFEGHH